MKARVEKIDLLTNQLHTIWFRPEKKLGFTAGQFVEAYLPHTNPDDRGEKRWFTLSSSPTEDLLSITTRFVSGGSSFKHALAKLKIGDSLEISESMGDFVLPKDQTIPLIFVAAGIGVTPFRSMIKWSLDSSEKRNITVILGVTNPEEAVFVELFKHYGVDPVIVVSRPEPTWQGKTGHLSAELVANIVGTIEEQRIYMSGPEQMVEAMVKDFLAAGIDESQLIGDYFPGYPSV